MGFEEGERLRRAVRPVLPVGAEGEGLSVMELQKLLDENQSVLDPSAKEQSPHRSGQQDLTDEAVNSHNDAPC